MSHKTISPTSCNHNHPTIAGFPWLLAVLTFFLLVETTWAEPLSPDRRQRTTPGLMLDTRARQAACDELLFTADGKELLGTGDDKVVRIFRMEGNTLETKASRTLRWPIYRESRGTIYAMALSPNDGQARVAIGGNGLKNGAVAVLNRASGAILHMLDAPKTTAVTWQLAFAPDGQTVILGTDFGEIYRWKLNGKNNVALFAATQNPKQTRNRVRLLHFVDKTSFLSLAEDGSLRKWNLDTPEASPTIVIPRVQMPNPSQVAISDDGKWLAVVGEGRNQQESLLAKDKVELINLSSKTNTMISMPANTKGHIPHSLAFSAGNKYLAIGTSEVDLTQKFFLETGGKICVYDLTSQQFLPGMMNVGNVVERLAFHPKQTQLLASAGGDNHEVRLWDIRKPETPLTTIRSEGRAIWDVAFSPNGKQFGFRQNRVAKPTHPNDWGTGNWKVFDIRNGKLDTQENFKAAEALKELRGWKLEPTQNANIWAVVDKSGKKYPLDQYGYNANENEMPRCYSFIDGPQPRLAIGHYWGVSIYDLTDKGPKLSRYCVGHEGRVQSIAISPNGETMITGSKDMTICCWSLADWIQQKELGVKFATRNGKLFVDKIDKGSPGWEVGLLEGNEILVLVDKRGVYYQAPDANLTELQSKHGFAIPKEYSRADATKINGFLQDAKPVNELIFVWKNKEGEIFGQLTTVRQRPLWRFFPAENNRYVTWLWRDYLYDTNDPEGDELVCWQVDDRSLNKAPTYHSLRDFSARLQTDVVRRKMQQTFVEPDLITFSDIEPPKADIQVVQKPTDKLNMTVNLLAQSLLNVYSAQDNQSLIRVELYLNEHLLLEERLNQGDKGVKTYSKMKYEIPKEKFRHGRNTLTLKVYNRADGIGEEGISEVYLPGTKVARSLYTMCCGVSDYTKANKSDSFRKILKGDGLDDGEMPDLPRPKLDAREVHDLFSREKRAGNLYADVKKQELLTDQEVTATGILKWIRDLEKTVQPDDVVVLFFSGHGYINKKNEPKSWFYLCHDGSQLKGIELEKALTSLNCRQVILFEACHSGGYSDHSRAIRSVTDRVPKLVITACKADQVTVADPTGKGIFTQALLDTPAMANRSNDNSINAVEFKDFFTKRVSFLYQDLRRRYPKDELFLKQPELTPLIFRQQPEPFEFLSVIKDKK